MSAYATLLERNQTFSATHDGGMADVEPTLRTLILTCGDHRVDPAHVLGLGPNEAAVLRNPAGRVTPAFLRELAVLATFAVEQGFAPGFELVLMQHTDCGMSYLRPSDHAAVLAPLFEVEPEALAQLHLADPFRAVAHDVEVLRANPLLPPSLVVSGAVLDLETGLLSTVVPPAPLGERTP